jgi:hypothetical protein
MRRRRLRPALLASGALALSVIALSACGSSGSSRSLTLDKLPLIRGARVVVQARQCDSGANAYCAVEAVIVDQRAGSSGAFVSSEHQFLRKLGWTSGAGDNGNERSAESPGSKVRVTYATAAGDLTGIDLGWIKRPRAITLSLSRLMFARTPAMSVMLEVGSA